MDGSSPDWEYPIMIGLALLLISVSVFLSYVVGIRKNRKAALDATYHFIFLNILSWTLLSVYVNILDESVGSPIPNGWIVLPVFVINILVITTLLLVYRRYLMLLGDPHTTPSQKSSPSLSPTVSIKPTFTFATIICILWIAVTAYTLVAIAGEDWFEPHEEEPWYDHYHIGAVVTKDAEGDYVVTIEKVDPDAIKISDLHYRILDENGAVVDGMYGNLENISTSSSASAGSISFLDKDDDGKLSAGDRFHILSVSNEGEAKPGYQLVIKPSGSREILNAFDEPFELP